MGTVTYSDDHVQSYIAQHFIPVQINVKEQPQMLDLFGASWTPAIIIHDADEQEHRRMEGYFDPRRFLEELALARLKTALERKEYEAAQKQADETLQLTHGDPTREPETLYWSAVADYKATKDVEKLKEGWGKLLTQFPGSDWARRAEVIRQ